MKKYLSAAKWTLVGFAVSLTLQALWVTNVPGMVD